MRYPVRFVRGIFFEKYHGYSGFRSEEIRRIRREYQNVHPIRWQGRPKRRTEPRFRERRNHPKAPTERRRPGRKMNRHSQPGRLLSGNRPGKGQNRPGYRQAELRNQEKRGFGDRIGHFPKTGRSGPGLPGRFQKGNGFRYRIREARARGRPENQNGHGKAGENRRALKQKRHQPHDIGLSECPFEFGIHQEARARKIR